MKKIDLFLQTIIYKVIEDLSDASIHYLIHARYFFYDTQMNDYEPIHLNKDSIRRIELLNVGFKCKMMLDGKDKDDIFSIVIPFHLIRSISRFSRSEFKNQEMLFSKSLI